MCLGKASINPFYLPLSEANIFCFGYILIYSASNTELNIRGKEMKSCVSSWTLLHREIVQQNKFLLY